MEISTQHVDGLNESDPVREPSAEDLSKLLHAFLLTVPFENLGQHAHPALGDSVAAVPAAKHIPSLDVHKTLKKVVYDRRHDSSASGARLIAWRQIGA